jgi:integrase
MTKIWAKSERAFDDRRMRTDVMAWRASMADHPRTADRAVVMLSTLLGWGVTQGRLALNVASGIPALYTSNRAAVIWTDADWLALLQHCSKDLVHALRLASMTGLRLGDLIRLETSHVGPLAIAYQTRKKNRRVVIPILPELRKLLNEIAGDGIILRNSRGQPWTESGLGGVFQKAKTKAKANGFNMELRIHDLRGTYATWLANRGLTDQEIGRIIAWSEKQVAEVRRRYVDERHVVASIVERLQAKNS